MSVHWWELDIGKLAAAVSWMYINLLTTENIVGYNGSKDGMLNTNVQYYRGILMETKCNWMEGKFNN